MSKQKEILICNYDVLYNSTLKPSSIYKYFQQIAREDLDSFGLTFDKLCEIGVAFVLVKMKSVLYKPVFGYDSLTLSSCHRKVKGATFIRDYLLERNGEVVGEASSYWALIDINSRRICRPSVISEYLSAPNALSSFEIDDKILVPDDVSLDKYNYTVVLSDLDENVHMNNTRYLDVCLDAIRLSEDEYVSSIRIDYLSEALLSDELELTFTPQAVDGVYYFSAQNKRTSSKCFDAKIYVSKI